MNEREDHSLYIHIPSKAGVKKSLVQRLFSSQTHEVFLFNKQTWKSKLPSEDDYIS